MLVLWVTSSRIRGHCTQRSWRAATRSSSKVSESAWYCSPSTTQNTDAVRLFSKAFEGDGQPPVAGQTALTVNSHTRNQPYQLPPIHNNDMLALYWWSRTCCGTIKSCNFRSRPTPHSLWWPAPQTERSLLSYRCPASSHWYSASCCCCCWRDPRWWTIWYRRG